MPKFSRLQSNPTIRQEELLAEAGITPMRRSILIELAEAGVFQLADRLTRSALAEQFGLDLSRLDQLVSDLEDLTQAGYAARTRDPIDAAIGSEDLELADEGLSSYVTGRRFDRSDDEAATQSGS